MAPALAAVMCLASGFFIVCLGWPQKIPIASDIFLKTSLSTGYGIGIFSVAFFLSRVFGVTNLIVIDAAGLVLLLAAIFGRPRVATFKHSSTRDAHEERGWFDRFLAAAFALALCAALYSAIMRTLVHLHGDGWDAFAIWNLHARFLFRGGPNWRDGFTPLISWSHPDYPLLLPAAVAHFWSYIGRESPAVPAVIGLLFTFSAVGLLYSALVTLSGRTAAMLGGITLLTTPSFIELGTWQYADVPLSFFFLATVVLLSLHDARVGGDGSKCFSGLLALAGLAAGFAAWTKNEGVLFLCAIIAARYILIRRDRSTSPANGARVLPVIIPFLLAAVPMFLLIFYFKHFVAPPGDLFSDPATMLHKLQDRTRYIAVLLWFAREFFRFGGWLIPTTLLLAGYYFVAGKESRSQSDLAVRANVVALALTLVGYFAIYLITPYDIYWHLRFSLGRLFLQIWPSVIFLFFLAVGDSPARISSASASAGGP